MRSKNLRSNLGIHIEILKALSCEVSANPTRILQRANLSNDRLRRYLNVLVNNELVAVNRADGKRSYSLTPTGRSFLEEMTEKEEFLSSYGLSL